MVRFTNYDLRITILPSQGNDHPNQRRRHRRPRHRSTKACRRRHRHDYRPAAPGQRVQPLRHHAPTAALHPPLLHAHRRRRHTRRIACAPSRNSPRNSRWSSPASTAAATWGPTSTSRARWPPPSKPPSSASPPSRSANIAKAAALILNPTGPALTRWATQVLAQLQEQNFRSAHSGTSTSPAWNPPTPSRASSSAPARATLPVQYQLQGDHLLYCGNYHHAHQRTRQRHCPLLRRRHFHHPRGYINPAPSQAHGIANPWAFAQMRAFAKSNSHYKARRLYPHPYPHLLHCNSMDDRCADYEPISQATNARTLAAKIYYAKT